MQCCLKTENCCLSAFTKPPLDFHIQGSKILIFGLAASQTFRNIQKNLKGLEKPQFIHINTHLMSQIQILTKESLFLASIFSKNLFHLIIIQHNIQVKTAKYHVLIKFVTNQHCFENIQQCITFLVLKFLMRCDITNPKFG